MISAPGAPPAAGSSRTTRIERTVNPECPEPEHVGIASGAAGASQNCSFRTTNPSPAGRLITVFGGGVPLITRDPIFTPTNEVPESLDEAEPDAVLDACDFTRAAATVQSPAGVFRMQTLATEAKSADEAVDCVSVPLDWSSATPA